MNNDKKTQYIIISAVVILLFIVIAISTYFIVVRHNEKKDTLVVKFNQIYSSDYELRFMGDYFIGMYEPNNISVVINNKGEEVYTTQENVYFDNLYMLKDGNILIYNTKDNKLTVFIFDGKTISLLYTVDGANNVKPIICKNSYQEYIVGFVSHIDSNTYIYDVLTGERLELLDTDLMADNVIGDIYYVNNDNYLIVKNSDNLMGVIDYTGRVIINYEYKNLINAYNNSFVAVNDKDKYGIISNKGEVLVKFNYNVIDIYPNYFLIVNSSNKMAVFDKEYNNITGFTMNYDTLLTYDLRSTMNSIKLYESGGRLFVLNNYMEDMNKTEYDYHNLYVISNGKVFKTINQIGFNIDGLIYIYNEDYVIDIYDTDFNLVFSVELDNVKKINKIQYVSNKVINIDYVDFDDQNKNKYYDTDGNEVEFALGKLVFRNDDYQGYIKEKEYRKVLSIIDNEGEELRDISGEKIAINGNYLIVDNSIYEIVRSGS